MQTKKNAFLTFCFACVPGCGQMYQGYMKRGVSLLFWTVSIFATGILLNVAAIAAMTSVLWAYSFFDTFNIRNLAPEQREAFYDDYVPSRRWLAENHLDTLVRSGRAAKLVGWVLVVIGIVTLYQNFLWRLIDIIGERFPFIWSVYYSLPTFVLGVGILLAGIWLLRRTGAAKQQPPAEDDIVPYTGDAEDA